MKPNGMPKLWDKAGPRSGVFLKAAIGQNPRWS
jgi:hypothetical protein